MVTPEQHRVLAYLGTKGAAPLADVARDCLRGSRLDWAERALADLEDLGLVTALALGGDSFLLITDRGRRLGPGH